ncbi:DNA topoisomerase 1 [Slackia heliotrinireducens]|uniref:DNA topoisomerase 1 n=1 Tax=Slackia heliotrinireducens (strain ATCC 29202 / DSM 20476 / NCTC 11029 / RHS 1) TaxID=471855 RepID=C7N1R3_SLAHD|nr:DNA topoisomerase I [Slackia heliotrinireducens]ACV23354.1 topoisomerase IA [Slackia heliotrinireducens DSM 20476]VEH02597.1 DNA topoisomerase 1 [Slackia heliotrinireducens]
MKLVVTEKNNAAQRIAELLGVKKPKSDKVYNTPVYRFERDGEEWVSIGLRGHILEPDFVPTITYKRNKGWLATPDDGASYKVDIPSFLPKPPFKTKRKPFLADGVAIGGSWKMDALPYLVYAPIQKNPKEKDIIRSLKNLAKKADDIIIATDFDREGELIGSDALSCIREVNTTAPVSRARYSALIKPEITHAFENLVELDMNLAHAGESRQEIDLIWGAVLTRYLTIVKFAGYGNVRSSGRVQTPTLALIVERERERMAFVPEDYWVIKAKFSDGIEPFEATHKEGRFKTQEAADAVMNAVNGAQFGTVSGIEKRKRTVSAPTPFNTTGLMAAAAAEGLSPARTMRLAESLYMAGYTSYPRVDNTVYPSSFDLPAMVKTLSEVPAYEPYCRQLLAKGTLTPTRGKQESTDHPPIVPMQAASPDKLQPAEWKLYNLIARRFLATLSDAAVIEGTKVSVDVNDETFITRGDVVVKPGFRAIYPYGAKKDTILPQLNEGQQVDFLGATCEQKQTEPPARYSQGKLIQEMEKLGLGTKATRHSIIDRLYNVKYIQNDPIEPSQLGIAVCDALGRFAPQITSPGMTAELEKDMNQIADGDKTQKEVVDLSRDILNDVLKELMPHSEEVASALGDAVAADAYVGTCPKCGKDLQMRASNKTKSMFIGCSGWPECDVTYPLPKGKVEVVEEKCPVCGMPQIKVTAFRSKPRVQCIDPNCDSNQEPDVIVGACKACAEKGLDKKLIAQRNPRTLKRFIRCENYEECGVSYPLPQHGELKATEEVCPDCGAPMVIVTTGRGPWKLCPNFDCPGKEKEEGAEDKKAPAKRTTRKTATKKTTRKTSK